MSAFFMMAIIPAQLSATTANNPVTMEATVPSESEVAATLNARLMEIQEMDLSAMNRVEKRALRSEVLAIKSELKSNSGGVYL
nr:hypothetical protein [Saprospiraceae bacterium]